MSRDWCSKCQSPEVIGVRVRSIGYDGALYWTCEGCDYAWPRLFAMQPKLRKRSKLAAAEHNKLNGWVGTRW